MKKSIFFSLVLVMAMAEAQLSLDNGLVDEHADTMFSLSQQYGDFWLSTNGARCDWYTQKSGMITRLSPDGKVQKIFESNGPINLKWCQSGGHIWVVGESIHTDMPATSHYIYKLNMDWQVLAQTLEYLGATTYLHLGADKDGGIYVLSRVYLAKIKPDGSGYEWRKASQTYTSTSIAFLQDRFWLCGPNGLQYLDTTGNKFDVNSEIDSLSLLKADTTNLRLAVANKDSLTWYNAQLQLLKTYTLPEGTDSVLSLTLQGDTALVGIRISGYYYASAYDIYTGPVGAPVPTGSYPPHYLAMAANGTWVQAINHHTVYLRSYEGGNWYNAGYSVRLESARWVDTLYHVGRPDYPDNWIKLIPEVTVRNTGTQPVDSLYLLSHQGTGWNNCPQEWIGPIRFSPPLMPGEATILETTDGGTYNGSFATPGDVKSLSFSVLYPNGHLNNSTTAGIALTHTYTGRPTTQTQLPLKAYPNPATTYLTVAGEARGATLHLRSADGHLLHTQPYTAGQRLDLSAYAAGLYLLEVLSSEGVYRERIVKSD